MDETKMCRTPQDTSTHASRNGSGPRSLVELTARSLETARVEAVLCSGRIPDGIGIRIGRGIGIGSGNGNGIGDGNP
jgi:hypothetical protein